jgi:hypothetical protein
MIIFENGTEIENHGNIIGMSRDIRGKVRDSLEIIFRDADYETLESLFIDGARFSVKIPQIPDIPGEPGEPNESDSPDDSNTPNDPGVPAPADDQGSTDKPSEPNYHVYDKFEYSVAGDIIDKRDGTFVVYMGVKTETESLEESFAETLLEMAGE